MLALADKVSADLQAIIRKRPRLLADLIRQLKESPDEAVLRAVREVLEDNRLGFRFPEVHDAVRCTIEFQRTLHTPDHGRDYPLPPGLGSFPLRHPDDYVVRLPKAGRMRGVVIAPMHLAEAMWINFHSDYPSAVKVVTGKVCAITDDSWGDRVNRDPQYYTVLPEQLWLDGYCVEERAVRQFDAMPLGEGYTVEEHLTSASVHGGLQLVAYPMKAERYEAFQLEWDGLRDDVVYLGEPACDRTRKAGPGAEKHCRWSGGLTVWDTRSLGRRQPTDDVNVRPRRTG